MKIEKPVITLDLETTGTWVEKDRIVEIAMIKLLPDGSRESYHSHVNPGMPIPARVSEITGIYDADVKDAPRFKEIAEKVVGFIGDCDLAGFNVERFDLVLMERELFEAGIKFEWRARTIYDAQRIYHRHEKRDLKAAYQFYCGKELIGAHTAMADTEATVEILESQTTRYGDPAQGIISLRDFGYEKMDDFYDREKKFRWWNGKLYPVFGKYARKTPLQEIAKKDRSYLQWLMTTDFSEEVKTLLEGAMEGRFPQPPKPPG